MAMETSLHIKAITHIIWISHSIFIDTQASLYRPVHSQNRKFKLESKPDPSQNLYMAEPHQIQLLALKSFRLMRSLYLWKRRKRTS